MDDLPYLFAKLRTGDITKFNGSIARKAAHSRHTSLGIS
ncbi:hypothetical protein VAA_04074 [Vibrio anguillarum 775]|nr:hypothetical protein VAA_04074 [Vibrio anguillarum 775]ARV28012.1 hypothetical protein A6A12_3003 [Vibrio anguillarum]